MITIYGLTDEFGQIRYVGQTGDAVARYKSHKYGKWNFTPSGFAVLERVTSRKDANSSETKWIQFFGKDNLHNRSVKGAVSPRRKNLKAFLAMLTPQHDAFLRQMAAKHGHTNRSLVLRTVLELELRRLSNRR